MTDPRSDGRLIPDMAASGRGGRLHAPAVERNAEPIRAVLADLLGPRGTILEIGAGTGQHAAHLAAAFPAWRWVPSEFGAEALASIAAWRASADLPNLAAPLTIDASKDWAADPAVARLSPDAVFSANVTHIAPWPVTEGLVAGAGRVLQPGGMLILYGPFRLAGQHTGPGNVAFDVSLRANDPAWGIRDVDDIAGLAEAAGFDPPRITTMPADNRIVAFRRG